MKWLKFLFAILLLYSCSPKLHFSNQSFTGFDDLIEVNYLISDQNARENKLAFLFFENPDTNNALQKEMLQLLHKDDWQIVVPIPVGEDPIQAQTLDNRKTRIGSAIQLYYELQEQRILDSNSTILLVGLKEQSYLLPQLSKAFNSDYHIMVNSGPHSYLYELERLQYLEDSSYLKHPEIQGLLISNTKQLQAKVQNVLGRNVADVHFGHNTNSDWLSYYNHQTSNDFLGGESRGYLLLSEDYPLVGAESRIYLNALKDLNTKGTLQILPLEGNADYSREEEREILINNLKQLLSSFR